MTVLRECIDGIQTSWKTTGYPLIVIGTTSASGSLPAGFVSCFKQEILFEVSYRSNLLTSGPSFYFC